MALPLLMDLPQSVMEAILLNLEPTELDNCKLVSKRMGSLAASMDECVYHQFMRRQNLNKMRMDHIKKGYLEGVDISREQMMQDGFNRGFQLGSEQGFDAAFHRGSLAALAMFCHRSEVKLSQPTGKAAKDSPVSVCDPSDLRHLCDMCNEHNAQFAWLDISEATGATSLEGAPRTAVASVISSRRRPAAALEVSSECANTPSKLSKLAPAAASTQELGGQMTGMLQALRISVPALKGTRLPPRSPSCAAVAAPAQDDLDDDDLDAFM